MGPTYAASLSEFDVSTAEHALEPYEHLFDAIAKK